MNEKKINKIQSLGINHLEEVQMTYIHHCRHGLYYGFKLFVLSISSIIHAFFPMILKFHAAKGVIDIYNNITLLTHISELLKKDKNAKI